MSMLSFSGPVYSVFPAILKLGIHNCFKSTASAERNTWSKWIPEAILERRQVPY